MKIIKDKFPNLKLCEHKDESRILRTCSGCDEVILPHSWYYFGKDEYGYEILLHKFCAELPTEIEYPLHLLKLIHLTEEICHFCNRRGGGRFMYRSSNYRYYIDIICAGDATLRLLSTKSPKERERMALKDHSHPHQLKLLHIQRRHDDDDDGDDDDAEDGDDNIRKCKACLQPILDSSYYICTEESEGCKDYFLHRVCGELPLEMKHELHLLHPLMLMLSPPADHFQCFACGKFCQGHIYSCRTCSFQLHIICATTASRVLEHKCHQHSLMLLPMSNPSLFCSACCKVHEGIFYQCNTCVVFFIHRDCAMLGYEIYHPSHQGHPLRLGCHLDGSKERNKCDICLKNIYYGTGWFYFCWECKFYSHLNCIISSDNDEETPKIDPEIPRLPWEETDNESGTVGTVGLLNMKLRSVQNDEDTAMDTINHFSHPKHPLILQRDVPREANPYSDGEITLTTQCNGCSKQISAPLYSCADCHFYIHKSCAFLPSSVAQHHGHAEYHNSRLLLVTEPWHETRIFKCEFCEEYCNGFSYQCEDESCNYQTDVECAFLPGQIVHKAHSSHSLALVEKPHFLGNMFKCCSRSYGGIYGVIYVYKCDTCSFMIHTRCAMYPAKADHRFDCDSPFLLSYNPSQIEPNEYHYCEICEFQVDPKVWFYFSSKWGGQIMHSDCILLRYKAAVSHPNFKSVSSLLEVDIHPHPLHLYPAISFVRCDHCKIKMKDHNVDDITDVHHSFYVAYFCDEWDCKYKIHVECAKKLIQEAKGDTPASSKRKQILEQSSSISTN